MSFSSAKEKDPSQWQNDSLILLDALENIQTYIRICQSALGNKEYSEVYTDIECFLGEINDKVQDIIISLEEKHE